MKNNEYGSGKRDFRGSAMTFEEVKIGDSIRCIYSNSHKFCGRVIDKNPQEIVIAGLGNDKYYLNRQYVNKIDLEK
jgi:hypothetical protein